MKIARLVGAASAILCGATLAHAETFESVGQKHPVRITSSEIIEISSATLNSGQHLKCDAVYHVTDRNDYLLGGCNASYSGGTFKEQFPTGHGRIRLRPAH